jgi:hypothetical protein
MVLELQPNLQGKAGEWRIGAMPLFMDHHRHVEGLTAEAVADVHK